MREKKGYFITIMVASLLLYFLLYAAEIQSTRHVRQTTAGRVCKDIQVKPENSSVTFCTDRLARRENRVEDIFCQKIPEFEKELKNPCFYDYGKDLVPTLKCLPYFYIIGMDKCGTTDLHSRMMSHPHIRGNKGSLNKETQFWTWSRYGVGHKHQINHNWTLDEYFDMFRETAKEIQENSTRNIITGDASPMDLWDLRFWKRIPQNFGKSTPEVLTPHVVKYIHKDRTPKFMIQLREPVERLYSDYFFLQQGTSPGSFHNAVVRAIQMFKDCTGTQSLRQCVYDNDLYNKLPTRIHLGCYSVFIQEWLNVFPRSAFHITRTEDFHTNMTETLTSVFKFLKIEQLPSETMDKVAMMKRKHVTKNKTGQMLPETYRVLKEFYAPFLRETATLLNDRRFLWNDVYMKHNRQQNKLN